MSTINAIFTIAARDITKLFRDRTRMLVSLIFPLVFIGILGSSLQANIGNALGFNLLVYTLIGVIGQTLFQSTSSGLISLVADRENDFAQEIFVSPTPRLAIIFGKILGESIVSFILSLGIVLYVFVLQIPIDIGKLMLIFPAGIICCLLGGAFGVLVMSRLKDQRSASQVFPFLIFPQFFLAGVFTPNQNLPPILFFLSRISPMTYAVDWLRSLYYNGMPEAQKATLYSPILNFVVILTLFVIMLTIGTSLFVRNERNR